MTNRMTARAESFVTRRPASEPLTIQDELIAVLTPHPGGLRRWSVMRALREMRNRDGRAVSLKFEIEVERAFRGACSNEPNTVVREPLFYRPEGKAGEVWAVHPHAQTQDPVQHEEARDGEA